MKVIISLVSAFMICFSGAMSVSAAATCAPIQRAKIAAVQEILDLYKSEPDTNYTVARQILLKSLANGDDSYTLYELAPYGMLSSFMSMATFLYRLRTEVLL